MKYNILIIAAAIFLFPVQTAFAQIDEAALREQISLKEGEIKKLEAEEAVYKQELSKTQSQSKTLKGQISLIDSQIKQLTVNLKITKAKISKTESDIKLHSRGIKEKEKEIKVVPHRSEGTERSSFVRRLRRLPTQHSELFSSGESDEG